MSRLLAVVGIASGTALAGLLSLSPIALADGPQQIALTAADLSFTPNSIQMVVGQPVQLTITNLGQLDNDPQEQVDNAAQGVLDVDFDKGDTSTVTFVPTTAGTYSFQCDQPGHADAGMKGTFVVTDGASGSQGLTADNGDAAASS